MQTGIRRHLPPITISSSSELLSVQTAPATANSSPRITKTMNNSNPHLSSYDDYFANVLSSPRKIPLNQAQSNPSTPHVLKSMKSDRPVRSQSFRHPSRLSVQVRRHPFADAAQEEYERRRSTPSIHGSSTTHSRFRYRPLDVTRTDVWPKARETTIFEDHFLNLVDSDDYTRVREFNIDEKGTVVSRGDSFRLKSPTYHKEGIRNFDRSVLSNDSNSSQSTTDYSNTGVSNNEKDENNQPSTSTTTFYDIYVLGLTGVGKSALIGQFMTSYHHNNYATDIEQSDNTVSIIIGDKESELTFHEIDSHNDCSWKDCKADIYLLVYSIDSKSSFREVMNIVDYLRESLSARNTPIVMAANKVDLERRRSVSKTDAKNAAMTYSFMHYEVSVALNLEVDDLLVGLIAEIKHSIKSDSLNYSLEPSKEKNNTEMMEKSNDFKAAIRRYSKRRRKQMGDTNEKKTNKCTHFKSNLWERFRNLRRLLPKLNY